MSMQRPINWSGGGLKPLISKGQQSSAAKQVQEDMASKIVLNQANHEAARQSNCDSSIPRSPTHLRIFLSRSTLVVGIIILLLAVSTNGQSTCSGANVDPNATPLWKGECVCVAGYIWNPSTSSCDPCSLSGSTQGSCRCAVGRIWRGSIRICVVPATAINCATFPNNGETDPVQTPKACNCEAGYEWNPFFLRCQYVCTEITFYNIGARPSGQHVCPCITNTVWSATSKTC